ncbi:type I-C CRISPR-associated protein Cas5c [Actinoalloteichus hymeniacidonis]|uniref:pre-crRNA processing endonuclease n=1 Tax=Actinoalloteichus hymeniacidonis TaxID=340345 RepID=A0AAC9HQA5_9PSEU|nr:type I-C CRISPR-associated protein Cas5c [Actinoalloteichus hymeniacidonis]AOS63408.1 CRISPR-associated protein Cas5 [Actinoalloteichus hymeniacidonis]MBB5908551.1 CRISPR-associated protein Cas5d [Actinoalloteichus hymeniacidonis]
MTAHRAMNSRGRVSMQVWGEAALFTRPEFKAERVTYPCLTPTAAVGVLESIYWHPGMRYEMDRIEVLKPIAQFAIRRNETSAVPSVRSALAGKILNTATPEARTQRMSLCLRDVGYRIHAWIQVLDGADKPLPAYRDQFNRRLRRGACFSQPYLGSREFVADFGVLDETPLQQNLDLDMGLMPHSADYDRAGKLVRWNWFSAELKGGVLDVPRQGLTPSSAESALEAAG